MIGSSSDTYWATAESVRADLRREPGLLLRLAENAFAVSETLREGYVANTATFVADLKRAMTAADEGRRAHSVLPLRSVADTTWAHARGEVTTFVDGGIGRLRAGGHAPILLRVGSYTVRAGERDLTRREGFRYYPVILGDLEGGSKERDDFPDIARIIAELCGGLAALERTPDLAVLMFHGPLVYHVIDKYVGHTPFTERDVDLFLSYYAPDSALGEKLKEDFLREARRDIYPRLTPRAAEWATRRLFEPLALMAFLQRRLIAGARARPNKPLIAGVIERGGRSRDFVERILLARVFQGLRARGNADYFNKLYGRTGFSSPKRLLDSTGYTDALLLSLLLEPGQVTESWVGVKHNGLRVAPVLLPNDTEPGLVDYTALRNSAIGFPPVRSLYVRVSPESEPVRVETFKELGEEHSLAAARRTYLYAGLLPGYGFPAGLDTVDKYARVPAWMSDAYGKLIRYHLGAALQRGEVDDRELRRVLAHTIYMNGRDWLLRPQ